MAFRQTAFDPMNSQELRRNDPQLDFTSMDKKLAQQMASMKIVDDKKRREIEKICQESDELKALQEKIRLAYLNKERASQITENQFRKQVNLVSCFALLLTLYSRNEMPLWK